MQGCCKYHYEKYLKEQNLTKKERFLKNLNSLVISLILMVFILFVLFLIMPQRPKLEYITNDIKSYNIAQIQKTQDLGNSNEDVLKYEKALQNIEGDIIFGGKNGAKFNVQYESIVNNYSNLKLNEGEYVMLIEKFNEFNKQNEYFIIDRFRLIQVFIIFLFFIILTIVLTGFKGVGSTLGLIYSVFVVLLFTIPQIVNGGNPIFVSIVSAILILSISIFAAHGWNRSTLISFTSTVLTIVISMAISYISVRITSLSGLSSEEAYSLNSNEILSKINLQGLLLGGIILGTLGVLDDITTSQVAIVEELIKLDPVIKTKDLVLRAMRVGKEHIASLVNTLALAYIGTSLPLIINIYLFNTSPFWVILNGEIISTEIVRTLSGSFALLLAVPITTVFSAIYFTKLHKKPENIKLRSRDADFTFG
jgi:uncharacterized membrane protein